MTLPVVMVGAGGHAKVLLDILGEMSCEVIGYINPFRQSDWSDEIAYLGDDEAVRHFRPDRVLLSNGVGSVDSMARRAEIFLRFKGMGYNFITTIHPSAVIASDVELGEGCQVMAGAVLQPDVRCSNNIIINTRAGVDHDCSIGAHSHISVGATLSGAVRVGAMTHIGAGSTITQGVSIGDHCLIAAGAVVVGDVAEDETYAGVPARRKLS